MPRINTYTDNTSIEDDDKLLTYDTQGAATKLTAFSRIWTWIQSKIHAITASTSAWTASNDKVVVDRNGTLSRIDYSILAKAIVESYNGSTLAGSAQAVKTAIDALNSNTRTPTYTTLASLYSDGIALAPTHSSRFAIIHSDVTAALTNNKASGACRGFITKADNTTVDIFMYGIATEKIFIARMTGASTVSKCVLYTSIERAVYTPTITAGTGFTCDNITCKYAKYGNIMMINGRFNITNAGSTDATIKISIPSGYQMYDMGVGGVGGVAKDSAPAIDTSMITMRYNDATTLQIQKGAGNNSASYLGTGYVIFYATVFVE